MANKTRKGGASDCEAALTKLMDCVSPASVRLTKPKYAVTQRRRGIELMVTTREAPIVFTGETVATVAAEALESLDDPEEDPFVPAWSRLTRIQRQVVVQTLREQCARHMALAATAKVANSGAAYAEYEIADAFSAAVDALDQEDVDEHNSLLERERLAAAEAIPFTPSRTLKKTPHGSSTPRGAD